MSYLQQEGTIQMDTLTTTLNRYFDENVKLNRKEKSAAYEKVMPIIEGLAKYVKQVDPRFGSETIKVGSSFQGLKVGEPNEYDVNIPLEGMKPYTWGPATPRYYTLEKLLRQPNSSFGPSVPLHYYLGQKIGGMRKQVDEIEIIETTQPHPNPGGLFKFVPLNSDVPMWIHTDDLTFANDLIPILLKKHYKKLLIEGIRHLGLREKVKVDRRFHGPAITLYIQAGDIGDGIVISIDFSVVISRATCFPNEAGWPHPGTSWPSGQKKDIIRNIGVSLVARRDLHWMVSPALAEKELMKGIDQPGECRKPAHRIMKKLNEDLWSKRTKAISSYALKNVLFYECERYPNGSAWHTDKLAERIMSMTKMLYDCICKGELKLYFLPQRNLLEKDNENERNELQNAKGRIEQFLDDPLGMMQQHNII